MQINTDVLVVGAGPAGSMAARVLAKNDIDVLVIDKKAEIGTPKRCAEGIVKSTLDEVDIEYDPRWIASEINGIEIVASTGERIVLDDDEVKLPDTGYILERKVFDKHLTMDAIRSGAKVMIKTMATSLERVVDGVIVRARHMGEEIQIHAHIVIAADGPDSHVGRWAGLKTTIALKDMASCVQYEMANIKTNFNHVSIFIGKTAPGGYLWIFPKGKDIANVGLGVLKTHADKPAKYYLDTFIDTHEETIDAQPVEMNVGADPVCGIMEDRYGDNIMVVGDAAGFIDPLTGDGIRTALLSGKYAGEVAVDAILNGDYSKSALKDYYDITEERINTSFKKFNKVKEFLLTLDDNQLSDIVHELSKMTIDSIDVKFIVKAIVKASPKSLLKIGKLF